MCLILYVLLDYFFVTQTLDTRFFTDVCMLWKGSCMVPTGNDVSLLWKGSCWRPLVLMYLCTAWKGSCWCPLVLMYACSRREAAGVHWSWCILALEWKLLVSTGPHVSLHWKGSCWCPLVLMYPCTGTESAGVHWSWCIHALEGRLLVSTGPDVSLHWKGSCWCSLALMHIVVQAEAAFNAAIIDTCVNTGRALARGRVARRRSLQV